MLRLFLASKSIAGGSRARGRQPRIVRNKLYAVNAHVNTLTRSTSGIACFLCAPRGFRHSASS
jgi:hypothetical protein